MMMMSEVRDQSDVVKSNDSKEVTCARAGRWSVRNDSRLMQVQSGMCEVMDVLVYSE
jgi:hypothetical protein